MPGWRQDLPDNSFLESVVAPATTPEGEAVSSAQPSVADSLLAALQPTARSPVRRVDPALPALPDVPTVDPSSIASSLAASLAPAQLPTAKIPAPSIANITQISNELAATFDAMDADYPDLAEKLRQNPRLMFVVPEIAAVVKSFYGDYDAAASVAEYLTTDSNQVGFDHWSQRLEEAPATTQFLHDYASFFHQDELDVIATVYSALNSSGQDNLSAKAWRWINRGTGKGEGVQDLRNDDTRRELLSWLYREGSKEQEHEGAEQTKLGMVGRVVDTPRRVLWNAVSDGFAWLTSIGDPVSQTYRSALTIGQNLAITQGIDPSEKQWSTWSGLYDGLSATVGDPINVLFGIGVAAKMSKSVAIADEVASLGRWARVQKAFKAAIPFLGRSEVELPRFSRAPSMRFVYTILGKTKDQLFERAVQKGVLDDMYDLMRTRGFAAVAERYPQFKPLLGGASDILEGTTSAADFAAVARQAYNLEWLGEESLGFSKVQNDLAALYKRRDAMKAQAVGDGTLSIQAMAQDATYVNVARSGVYEGTVEAGSLLAKSDLVSDGTAKIVLHGRPKVRHVDEKFLKSFLNWTEQLRNGTRGLNVDVLDSTIAKVLNGRPATLTDVEQRMFMQFVDQYGVDLLDFGTDGVLLTKQGAGKAVVALDDATIMYDATKFRDIDREVMRLEAVRANMKASTRTAWVISDLPSKVTSEWKLVLKPWRKYASNNATTWFGRFRRTTAAKLFTQSAGNSIDLSHAGTGATELQRFLAQLGADRDFVTDAVNTFVRAAREDRWEVVSEILQKAGDHIDNPILQHGFIQQVKRGGVFRFGIDTAGNEVMQGASRSREGLTVALPYLSNQTTDVFDLPGPELFETIRRFRTARRWDTLGLAGNDGRGLVRGLTRATMKKRERLADLFRSQLKARGIDTELFGREDLLAMAYSKVTGNQDGIGRLAAVLKRAEVSRRAGFTFFKQMQLVARPITWMLRVAALEEGLRAQFFQLPSAYRNPVAWMGSFHDAWVIAKVTAHRTKQLGTIGRVVREFLPEAQEFSPALVEGLAKKFPAFKEFLEGARLKPQTTIGLRAAFASFMEAGMYDLGSLRELEGAGLHVSRAMARRTKKLAVAAATLKKYHLAPDFDWGVDAAAIANKGFITMVTDQVGASTHTLEYLPGRMTERQLKIVGMGWGQQAVHHVEDPLVRRYALGRIEAASNGLGNAGLDGASMIHDPAWLRIRGSVKRASVHDNWFGEGVDVTETMLADAYLDKVLIPQTGHVLGPILGDDIVERGVRAGTLRRNKAAVLANGEEIRLTGANHGQVQRQLADFLEWGDSNSVAFPSQIAGRFDARMFFEDDGATIPRWWRKVSTRIMEFAGEKATQQLNRRPGWLAAFKDNFEHLHNVMGLPDDIARSIASDRASEIVNYVFYNLDNATPFLRSMNNFIPFFGALWEVAQTWAYKIPFAGSTVMGVPMVVRKVDRTFQALHDLGILSYDNLYDEDGNVQESSMRLNFDENPDTGTALGDVISKAGHSMLGLPRQLVTVMAGIHNMLSDNDVEFDDQGAFKDSIKFMVGSPLAYSGPQAHGIMAVNTMYLGLDPIANYAVNKIRVLAGTVADTKLTDLQEGESLQDVADRANVDVGTLIRENGVALRDKLGMDGYARLLNGHTAPSEVTFSGQDYLSIPKSSFVDTMMDNIVFPFGTEDSLAGTLYDFGPSWFGFVMRGWGLWQASGDPENWGTLNADGTVSLPAGEMGHLEALYHPMSKMQIVSEVNKQILHLEASEGLLTRWKDANVELERLTQRVTAAQLELVSSGDLTTITDPARNPELAEQWKQQQQYVQELNATIIKRALDNAGGAILFRGIAGVMSPGNPSTQFKEEQQVGEYWDALSLASGQIRGAANYHLPKTLEDYARRQTLVQEFIEDPSGDQAKAWLKEHYPGIAMFTNPKTFWAAGGKPPELTSMEDYVAQVNAGRREPIPPNVLMQKAIRADIGTEREIALRRQFGDDPWTAAQNIVNDWPAYKTILEDASVGYAGMDFWDEVHDGSAYKRWKERNRADTLTLAEETTKRFRDIVDSVDLLEAFAPSPDMSNKERQDYTSQLRTVAHSFRDFIGAWSDEVAGTFMDSPREQALNWYFDTVQAPYYDGLATLYAKIDETDDPEERSRIYEEIRLYQTDEFTKTYTSENGVQFPNALEFSWSKKSDVQRQQTLVHWVGMKPEWLGLNATTRLVEQSPTLRQYLPSTAADFQIYREFNLRLADLSDLKEPDPKTGIAQISLSDYSDRKKALEENLRAYLIDNGRSGEALYKELWPLERLQLAGMLPVSMQPYAEYATGVREQLQTLGKSARTKYGRAVILRVYTMIMQDMAANPQLRQDWSQLSDLMFGSNSIEAAFPALFYGGIYDEI